MSQARADSYDVLRREVTTVTREDIIRECREAKGQHEISEACARAIVRLHGRRQLWADAFVIRGELPPDEGTGRNAIDGGTRLWRSLFSRYEWMSADDRLMADMLGTFFHHSEV